MSGRCTWRPIRRKEAAAPQPSNYHGRPLSQDRVRDTLCDSLRASLGDAWALRLETHLWETSGDPQPSAAGAP